MPTTSIIWTVLLPLLAPAALPACTLWAAAGSQARTGTLLSKNRDWRPGQHQSLALVHPPDGHAYLGLFVDGGDRPGLKAGVNDQGLSIVSAAANLPRQAQPGRHGVMARILGGYASVDQLAADAGQVFAGARTAFFLVADRKEVMVAEVGPGGAWQAQRVASGTVAHTNHFLDPGLAARFNARIGASSALRLARIRELLAQGGPFTLERFAAMGRDRHDGPDNSLWRSGRECTLASWIVESPASGPARLRVVVANPGEPEQVRDLDLDAAFWRQARLGDP